jgi:hypothetical protein
MLKNNQEKRALEHAAVKIFIEINNLNHEIKYRLLYHQESPDAVLQDSLHRKLGVEITHLFYDADEAKMVLGRSTQSMHGLEKLEKLVEELNIRIQRKESKMDSYSTEYPISLIIRNASPIFGMSDLLRAKHLIYKPIGKFLNIWFISRDGSNEWLLIDLNNI